MDNITQIGRFLIVLGAILIVVGGLMVLGGKIPFIGRLPGDIIIQRKNFTLYLPIATSILISIILTILFYILGRK